MPSQGRQVPGMSNMQNRFQNRATVGGASHHYTSQARQEEPGKVRGPGLPLRVSSDTLRPERGVCGTPLYMRDRQQALQKEVKMSTTLQSRRRVLFFRVYISAGGRSVPESLLPTKTLSVHSDMEMGRHLHVPAVMVIDVL